MKDLYKAFKSRCSQLIKENKEHIDYSILSDYENFKDLFTEEQFKEVLKEKHNRCNKRNRTKNKIQDMLRYYTYCANRTNPKKLYLVFGTGTINDTYLERKSRTRDKLLNIYMLHHYEVAIINTDYGDKTERLHYHWIGITSEEPIPKMRNGKQCKSKKGFPLYVLPGNDYVLADFVPTVEPIVTTDLEKIRNYLLKLNNHSNKETTRRLRHIKNTDYRLWDLLENDKHQLEVKKRVMQRRTKEH